MKIKYLRDVTSPSAQVGKTGETKEVPDNIGNHLVSRGFAEFVLESEEKAASTKKKSKH